MGNRAEPRWGLLHLTFTATAFNSGFSSHYYKDDKHFIYFFPARLPRWQHACTDPLPAPGDPCPTSILPFLPGVLGQAVRSLCKTQAGNQHQAGKTPRSRETRPPPGRKLVIKHLQCHFKIREAKTNRYIRSSFF